MIAGGIVAVLLGLSLVAVRRLPSAEEHTAARDAGKAFGSSRTNEACLVEALRLGVACDDDANCEFLAGSVLRGCLAASQPTPGFCDGIPARDDFTAGTAWSTRIWEAHGKPHHGGIVADDPLREFCHP